MVTPVQPGEDEILAPDAFLIVAVVAPADSADSLALAGPLAAEIRLDGSVAIANVTPAGNVITWAPGTAAAPAPGLHSVAVTLKRSDGTQLAHREWSFTIIKPSASDSGATQTHRAGQSGRLYADLGQYSLDGHNTLDLAAGGNYRGYALGGKLRYGAEVATSNLNDGASQDRNTYRADVGYGRWLDFSVGDCRPAFSPLVLSGTRIRGLEAAARGWLKNDVDVANLEVTWGQVRRAAEPDVYERNVFAGRLSFGSGRVFQLGLSYLKGGDDVHSITRPVDTTNFLAFGGVDSVGDTTWDTTRIVKEGRSAEEDMVVGTDLALRLFGGKLQLYGAYAFSLYTRDINAGPIPDSTLDSAFGISFLHPQKWERFMTLNLSTLPLAGGTGIWNSSALNAGMRLDLPFRVLREQLDVEYSLQGANYYSMGVALPGTPEKGVTIRERLWLLKSRLLLDASYGRTTNDLDHLQAAATVANRLSVSAGLFYSPKAPSLSLTYAWSSTANSDTAYGFESGVSMVNATTCYNWRLGQFSGSVQVYCGWSGVDNGWRTSSFDSVHVLGADTTMHLSLGMYGFSLRTQVPGLPLVVNGSLMASSGSDSTLHIYTGSIDARYQVIAEILSVYLGLRVGAQRMPAAPEYSINLRVPFGAEFRHRSGHGVRWDGYLVRADNKFDIVNTLRYEWVF
jgi:hypothetical protein